jgi:hypothetical protein
MPRQKTVEKCHAIPLLSKSIRSIIDVKEDKDLDSLFTGSKTTALVDIVAGLNDFELIDFLVIQGPKA